MPKRTNSVLSFASISMEGILLPHPFTCFEMVADCLLCMEVDTNQMACVVVSNVLLCIDYCRKNVE